MSKSTAKVHRDNRILMKKHKGFYLHTMRSYYHFLGWTFIHILIHKTCLLAERYYCQHIIGPNSSYIQLLNSWTIKLHVDPPFVCIICTHNTSKEEDLHVALCLYCICMHNMH